MTTATSKPAPVPGDLHRWDDLQDGCLYVDLHIRNGVTRVDYAGCSGGRASWLLTRCGPEGRDDIHTWPCERYLYGDGPFAVVVAVGLETIEDFRAAIVAHRARTAA